MRALRVNLWASARSSAAPRGGDISGSVIHGGHVLTLRGWRCAWHNKFVSENGGRKHSIATMPRPVPSSKYHVLMELGKGGMAVVHAAMARGMGGFSKLVVLKKAREEFGDRPEAVRMFLNEARLSARMNHPNVVQVYEVYETKACRSS